MVRHRRWNWARPAPPCALHAPHPAQGLEPQQLQLPYTDVSSAEAKVTTLLVSVGSIQLTDINWALIMVMQKEAVTQRYASGPGPT